MLKFRTLPVKDRAGAIVENLDEKFIREILSSGNEKKRGGMNLSAYFEQEDPTHQHEDKSTDAFGRVLRALDIIPVSMPEYNLPATTLEEMANDKRSRLLVGELASRAWRKVAYGSISKQQQRLIMSTDMGAGSLMNPFAYSAPRMPMLEPAVPISALVARTQGIPSRTYRPFYIEDVDRAEVNMRVQEGADIPVVSFKESEKTIILKKYGRMIKATYESLRYMPIDTFAFFVMRTALAVEAEKVDRVYDVLTFGDGISGAPENFDAADLDPDAIDFALTLQAWISWKLKFKNPFMLTTHLSDEMTALKAMLLNVGNANIPLASAGGIYSGQQVELINPLADRTRAGILENAVPNVFTGFDQRLAVERIFEIGGQVSETDKWIENQTEGLTQTEVEAFAIIEKEAVKTLTLVSS